MIFEDTLNGILYLCYFPILLIISTNILIPRQEMYNNKSALLFVKVFHSDVRVHACTDIHTQLLCYSNENML